MIRGLLIFPLSPRDIWWERPYILLMAMKPEDITTYIKEDMPDAEVSIQDLRGDGDHYAVTVTSAAFQGKNRVQQHQMVYKSLKGHMGTTLHAMALKTIVKE